MSISMIRNDQQVLQGTREPMNQDWYRLIRDIVRAVNQTTVPVGGVVWCNLTAQNIADYFDSDGRGLAVTPYDGWHICNGNNSTPSMSAKFLRSSVTAAGGTGGSDSSAHTHAIDHDHGSFTSGAGSGHTHGLGLSSDTSYTGNSKTSLDGGTTVNITGDAASSTAKLYLNVNNAGADWTNNYKSVVSTESAHTHAADVPELTGASGAASASDNKPAYFELVPLIRVGGA